MSTYTDVNTIRNGLVALQVLALSNADEYLENLAEKGLESLAHLGAAQQNVQPTIESGRVLPAKKSNRKGSAPAKSG